MSMNLQCEEIELWQTPTYITYMCYSEEDGGWQGIRYRYIEWVKSRLDGVWNDEQELKNMKELISSHIIEIMSFKELHFYII